MGTGKPPLLKMYVDPEENHKGGLKAYLQDIVKKNKENWALEWGIKDGPKRGDDVLDFEEVKQDQEISKLFYATLKATLTDTRITVRNPKLVKAKTILVEGEPEQVHISILFKLPIVC